MKKRIIRTLISVISALSVFTSFTACIGTTPNHSGSWSGGASHEHEFEYKVSVDPTFARGGKLTGKCTVEGCGVTHDIDLPELNYNDYSTESIRDNCEEAGIVSFRYTVAGQYFVFKVLAPAGHSFNGNIIDPERVYDFDSPVCKDVILLHGVKVECNADPVKVIYECEVCHDYMEILVQRKHARADGDAGRLITEPTCENEGLLGYKCKYCNRDVAETLPKAHNFGYTLSEPSSGVYNLHCKCKTCGEEEDKKPNNVDKTVVPSTCTEAGSQTLSCVLSDGETIELTTVLPLARHRYLGEEVDLDPVPVAIFGEDAFCLGSDKPLSCKAEDMIRGIFTCTVCGGSFYADVRLAHTPPAGVSGTYECTVCHKVVTGK